MEKLLTKTSTRNAVSQNVEHKVDKYTLVKYLTNQEELHGFIKNQARLLSHIFSFFLVVCLISMSSVFFQKELSGIPNNVLVLINFIILLYGIRLLFKGIGIYRKNDRYLKVLANDIRTIRSVLEKKTIEE